MARFLRSRTTMHVRASFLSAPCQQPGPRFLIPCRFGFSFQLSIFSPRTSDSPPTWSGGPWSRSPLSSSRFRAFAVDPSSTPCPISAFPRCRFPPCPPLRNLIACYLIQGSINSSSRFRVPTGLCGQHSLVRVRRGRRRQMSAHRDKPRAGQFGQGLPRHRSAAISPLSVSNDYVGFRAGPAF